MLGGAIFRIAKYAIIGALALMLGSQLIASVSTVVIAYRAGDLIPLMLVSMVALSLLRLSGSSILQEPAKTVVTIIGWSGGVYLAFTIFTITLENGLVISITSTAIVTIICATIRDPSEIRARINESFQTSLTLDFTPLGIDTESMTDDEIWFYSEKLSEVLKVLPISSEYQDHVIAQFRMRTELPMCLNILNDLVVLIVNSSKLHVDEVALSLQLPDEFELKESSHTLNKAVLAIPFINARHGMNTDEYCYITDPEASGVLIESPSPGITIFPSKDNVSVLVPRKYAIGLPTLSLSQDQMFKLIFERQIPKMQGDYDDNTG